MSSQCAFALDMDRAEIGRPEAAGARRDLQHFFVQLGLPRGRTTERLAAQVMARLDMTPGESPRSVAERMLVSWVERLVEQPLAASTRGAASARAAVVLSDAAARWPDAFLADEAAPDALRQALAAALPHPVPQEQPLAMPEQPLEPLYAPRLSPALRPAWIARRS